MPSIRVLPSPNKTQLTIEQKKTISIDLQTVVANALLLDTGHVEVLWLQVDFALNETDLAVEVVFSEDTSIIPELMYLLAEKISIYLLNCTILPKDIIEVSGWARPQLGAVFSSKTRPKR